MNQNITDINIDSATMGASDFGVAYTLRAYVLVYLLILLKGNYFGLDNYRDVGLYSHIYFFILKKCHYLIS